MKLIDFLLANQVPLDLKSYKVHLASHSNDSPLDAFYAGEFQNWQEWQTKKNFPRKNIVSLIQYEGVNTWLFAGVYRVLGHEWRADVKRFRYRTELLPGHEDWIGRVLVKYARAGRASYRIGAADGGDYMLSEIRAKKLTVEEFAGFNKTCVDYPKLKLIVGQQIESWKAPLSKVKGVYLITDRYNGKHYVGKADGVNAIWQRWCAYVATGHGGNKELIALLKSTPIEYRNNFQFSVLEIADMQTSDTTIEQRETYWKNVLMSRVPLGYNAN